ncbi:MAG TPA: alpha/beta fold hydrolase [Pyrinomonadaceae bacterium]|nr:alpha/beta fold hydrolase [Pyrinomonadaceae bacterium]
MFHFLSQHLWLIVGGGGAGVAGRYIQLRVRRAHRVILPDPSAELLRLHQLYGYNEHSLVGIAPGVRLWSRPELEGAVTFNDFGKVWLVPGDPLASVENQAAVADRFLRAARAQGRTVGFIPASERFAKHSRRLGLRAVKIGSAPYFDLATWAPRGDRAKKARAGVNQARRAGVEVTEVINIDETLIREASCLCNRWLKTRRSPTKFAWLFSVDLFQHSERKKYFTARDPTGRLVGFLAASPIPTRQGWYLEDVLRLPDAPNGTADLMVVEVLNLLKRDGAKLATLGTAPLAMEGALDLSISHSSKLSKLVSVVATVFAVFYNFDGVRRFKAKFAPSWWESEYILVSRNITAPPRIIYAFIHAIVPTGASDLVVRHVTRVWRRMKFAKKQAAIMASGVQSLVLPQEEKKVSQVEASSTFQSNSSSRQFVSVDGVKLHYVSAGSGRTVVLIHGNPGSHKDYTLAVFDKLAQSFHVVAFDRPGHGYSERHDSIANTVEVQAHLIRNALRKLSIEKPVLVGHSWGGSLVLAVAVAYQEDLSGIVLLAPAAYPTVSIEWWSLVPHVPVAGRFVVNTLTPLMGRAIVQESLKKAYHPQAVQNEYAQQCVRMWTRPEQVRACAYDERTLRSSLKVLSPRYSDIELPVVIVTGAADLLVEPEQHAYPLHRAIKGSELIVLPETGHELPQTRPDSVINAIETVWRVAPSR